MKQRRYCQSCSMPLDNTELQRTENDGSLSNEYYKYSYQHGAFIQSNMILKEMTLIVVSQIEKMKINSKIIDMAVNALPLLKRWKTATV